MSLRIWGPGFSSSSPAMSPDPSHSWLQSQFLGALVNVAAFQIPIPPSGLSDLSLSAGSASSQVQVRALVLVPAAPVFPTLCSCVTGCCECLDPLPPQHYLCGPVPLPGAKVAHLTLAFLCGPRGGQRVARVAEAGVGAHVVDTAPPSLAGVLQTLIVI